MSQPRIRTLKPENWQDEEVGQLSRDARLLRDVLITYSDDDGRWRQLPSAVIGFGYPYDDDMTASKLARWSDELGAAGLVIFYEVEGQRYGCFPNWHLHQQINKYRPSRLPECPDSRVVSYEEARTRKGLLRERSGSSTGTGNDLVREDSHPQAQARGSGSGSIPRSIPDPVDERRAQGADGRVSETVAILRTCSRLTFDESLAGVSSVLDAYPTLDHRKAAHLTVASASDPQYRTTDAGRALGYAFAKLDRNGGQGLTPFAGSKQGQTKPGRPDGAELERLIDQLFPSGVDRGRAAQSVLAAWGMGHRDPDTIREWTEKTDPELLAA